MKTRRETDLEIQVGFWSRLAQEAEQETRQLGRDKTALIERIKFLETAITKADEIECQWKRDTDIAEARASGAEYREKRAATVVDEKIHVLLLMFQELDRRHDFTHAEIRGAIKLMQGYAKTIAAEGSVGDIPF